MDGSHAARSISDKDILQAAVRVALTEGEHAGNIRLIIAQQQIPTTALDGNDYPPPPLAGRGGGPPAGAAPAPSPAAPR